MKYIVKKNTESVLGYCFGCAEQCSNVCTTQCMRDTTV